MENMIFTSRVMDVSNYLVQRENKFLVSLDLQDEFNRVEKSIESSYTSKLTELKTKNPIEYRINIFLNENKIRLLIPKHTFEIAMKYVGEKYDNNVTCYFDFTFEETVIDIPFVAKKYKHDVVSSGCVIDNAITTHIQKEVTSIFDGDKIDDKEKWYLVYEEIIPNCTFKQIHSF